MSEQQKYIIKDTFKEGEFNLREWTAPELTSPFECQEYMDNLNLKGRKIKQIKMIGLNYMHVREWIENKAFLMTFIFLMLQGNYMRRIPAVGMTENGELLISKATGFLILYLRK